MSLTPSERAEITDIARCAAISEIAEVFLNIHQTRQRRMRRAAIVTSASLGVLLIGGLAWSQLGATRYTPHPRTRATGKCMDGTWSYAYNRQGACAGHGGVKVFYK